MKRRFALIGIAAVLALTLHWSWAFGFMMPMSGMTSGVALGALPMDCPMGFVCPLHAADFSGVLADLAFASALLALIVLPVILLAFLISSSYFPILSLAVVTNNGPPVLLTVMKRE
jgi:hypothetical protein